MVLLLQPSFSLITPTSTSPTHPVMDALTHVLLLLCQVSFYNGHLVSLPGASSLSIARDLV